MSNFVFVCSTGDKERQARVAHTGQSVPDSDVPRGWPQNVVPMERATGVHGHVVGLRQVPGNVVRSDQFTRSIGRLRYGNR